MPSSERPHWRDRLASTGRAIETATLTVLLLGMIACSAVPPLMRNLPSRPAWLISRLNDWFGPVVPVADDLVKLSVLWLAVVGAVAASRDDRHIAINLVARYGRTSWQKPAALIASAFAAAVTGLLSWHAVRFVADSYRFEDTVLGDQPAWLFQLVLPVGFAIMCYRFVLRFVRQVRE